MKHTKDRLEKLEKIITIRIMQQNAETVCIFLIIMEESFLLE
ncbi:hypothetical protein [Thomasclavelia cocleata]|nr:hypothetical protein [Thomasclavelia cocleata]